jgi:uracil-DNA glycosylase
MTAAAFNDAAPGWKSLLEDLWQDHGDRIQSFLESEASDFQGMLEVLPPQGDIFRAFEMFPLEELKVVIIGQDPYHRKGEANGLCFSVPEGTKIPPSLRNVFKELARGSVGSGGGVVRTNPDLSDWARQGVLLLNTALTVREHSPGSHAGVWKDFTRSVVEHVGVGMSGVVFMLWGAHAQSFEDCIDARRNLVLKHSHPSPLSRKPFVGCGHFERCNEYLLETRSEYIRWM